MVVSTRKGQVRLAIVALVLVALGVAFAFLPIRVQGRIVEIATLGDWPLEWAIRTHFRNKQPELQSISDFIAENPEVERVSVAPTGLRASLQGEPSIGQEYENPNILQAIQSIEAYWVSVHDGQAHVFMGTEYRSGTAFRAGYTERGPGDRVIPNCSDINKAEREKIGVCAIDLDDRWFIRYQWEPEDIDELERAVEELEERS